jgi:Predicted acyltransferase
MIHFKTAIDLANLPDAKTIREEVFVKEQGFQHEFDEIDQTAIHIVVYDDEKPIATARTFPKQKDNTVYILGRVAVIEPYRGKNLGAYVLEHIEDVIKTKGAKQVELSAQTRVQGFYLKLGYEPFGEEYYDEYCPHITMKKTM